MRIWEIPEGGLKRNMTEALLELHGHSRRVGLVEWHPTTNNILFSAGYDYKVGSLVGSGDGEGEKRASLGKHYYFPEHVNQYHLIIHSFIHYTQLSIFCALHHFLESTEVGGICTAYCGTDGLEVTAHFVPTLSW